MQAQQQIVFHLPESWLGAGGTGLRPFYQRLQAGLDDLGVGWCNVALDRDQVMAQIDEDDDFHIINHGRFEHPRVLNAGIAYIYPFWNLDPTGIRAFSSIGGQKFRPAQLDGAAAKRFFGRLQARLVEGRQSRYEQPNDIEDLPARAAAAVFFQSENHRIVGETCYLDRWQMLLTTLEACDGAPVIVKPHPRELSQETFDQLLAWQQDYPQLHIALGNIHDIIAASERIVTINSAVGIEAYLHRKPVYLCGQTDFHHIATTAQNADMLRDALRADIQPRQYAKYIYWYFAKCCVSSGAQDLAERVVARIGAQGGQVTPG